VGVATSIGVCDGGSTPGGVLGHPTHTVRDTACDRPVSTARSKPTPVAYILYMKIALIVTAMLVCPGIVMGTISSYRAGQKPLKDLYLMIKKFTHRKK
jgi:hypothetical protein